MFLLIYIFVVILVNIDCNGYEYNTNPAILTDSIHIDLIRGNQVDMWIGEENVVFCRLINPKGFVNYDNFGRCKLSLDKVALEHHGHWEMYVGYPGKATWDMTNLIISVIEPEPKETVHTTVENFRPNITVTCSLPSDYQVRGCRLRGPQGTMLLASETTESVVEINETRYETYLEGSNCSFLINNPDLKDLGIWRCSMYTERESYYGFAKVLSSWLDNEPSVDDIGPFLRADHVNIHVSEGEPVTMSCSIDASIRYCYFRMYEDGTIFNVSPGLKSSSMEYVGSGFDAGECGLKLYDFKYPNRTWSPRRWSCNVALAAGNEQSSDFWIYIRERMDMHHETAGVGGSFIVIHGRMTSNQFEYCRFVRNDGYGFAHDHNLSDPRISVVESLSGGVCALSVREPTVLDYAPWTIVAKVIGEDVEVSGTTTGTRYPWNWYNLGYRNPWRTVGWIMLGLLVAFITFCCFGVFCRNRKEVTRSSVVEGPQNRPLPPPPYAPSAN